MEKVLITGASGYIALHCIVELLNNGYAVKGSLRSPNRESQVRTAIAKKIDTKNNLEFCTLDLTNDDGWEEELLLSLSLCFGGGHVDGVIVSNSPTVSANFETVDT